MKARRQLPTWVFLVLTPIAVLMAVFGSGAVQRDGVIAAIAGGVGLAADLILRRLP